MHRISIIVPVYKVEKYIHRCVDSILGQTFRDFELILVDDGSPDNCGAICDEYAAKDSRIHVIHQENGGLSAARNAGIDWAFANSDSQWLTFIDSDDWVHPEYLERLLNAVLEHHVAVSVCGYATTAGEEPDIAASEMIPRIWAPEDFYVEHNVNAIVAWGKLYRKEYFKTVRYPVGRIHEDEFTTHRILFLHDRIAVTELPLYYYFQNAQGITKSAWNEKHLDAWDAFWEQLVFFKSNGFHRAYTYRLERSFLRTCEMKERIDSMEEVDDQTRRRVNLKLKRFLRKLLILNRGLPKLSKAHQEWILLQAFPLPMHLYFAVRKLLK